MFYQQWLTTLRDLVDRVRGYMPDLLGAAALVLGGWALAFLMRTWTRRLVGSGLDRLARNTTVRGAMDGAGVRATLPGMIAAFMFWLILVFFVAAALETLGLPVVTSSLSRFAYYLPNVLAAVIIAFAGLVAGRLARSAVSAAAASAGLTYGPTVGLMGQGAVVLVAVELALEQLGVSGQLLVVLISVVVGATLTGAGLAFGLGARTAVSNIVASYYVAQVYRVGQTVRIGEVEGKIVHTTPTAVVVETREGRMLVPAKRFNEEPSLLRPEAG